MAEHKAALAKHFDISKSAVLAVLTGLSAFVARYSVEYDSRSHRTKQLSGITTPAFNDKLSGIDTLRALLKKLQRDAGTIGFDLESPEFAAISDARNSIRALQVAIGGQWTAHNDAAWVDSGADAMLRFVVGKSDEFRNAIKATRDSTVAFRLELTKYLNSAGYRRELETPTENALALVDTAKVELAAALAESNAKRETAGSAPKAAPKKRKAGATDLGDRDSDVEGVDDDEDEDSEEDEEDSMIVSDDEDDDDDDSGSGDEDEEGDEDEDDGALDIDDDELDPIKPELLTAPRALRPRSAATINAMLDVEAEIKARVRAALIAKGVPVDEADGEDDDESASDDYEPTPKRACPEPAGARSATSSTAPAAAATTAAATGPAIDDFVPPDDCF